MSDGLRKGASTASTLSNTKGDAIEHEDELWFGDLISLKVRVYTSGRVRRQAIPRPTNCDEGCTVVYCRSIRTALPRLPAHRPTFPPPIHPTFHRGWSAVHAPIIVTHSHQRPPRLFAAFSHAPFLVPQRHHPYALFHCHSHSYSRVSKRPRTPPRTPPLYLTPPTRHLPTTARVFTARSGGCDGL